MLKNSRGVRSFGRVSSQQARDEILGAQGLRCWIGKAETSNAGAETFASLESLSTGGLDQTKNNGECTQSCKKKHCAATMLAAVLLLATVGPCKRLGFIEATLLTSLDARRRLRVIVEGWALHQHQVERTAQPILPLEP